MSTSSHVIGKEFSVGLTTALVDLLKPSSEMPVRHLWSAPSRALLSKNKPTQEK